MNYRQWKKNYKKKHGYNPSAEVDKRKQIKKAKELFCSGSSLNRAMNNFVKSFNNAMADVFEGLSDACGKISKNLRGDYDVNGTD